MMLLADRHDVISQMEAYPLQSRQILAILRASKQTISFTLSG
ncbi:hypothetical protein [Aeromonas caviae]|nr:hypothetical protein [Aeromonas caviae]